MRAMRAMRQTMRATRACMSTTPRTLQQLVEHAEDPDLIKAAQRAHVELSSRVEEQVARCTELEGKAPTNRDLGTLTALYKGVATELAAGDEIAAAACVPAHATHVVRELLKNALVARIEKHVAKHGPNSDAWDEELPPVEIAVAASTISVVDHGGGLEDPDALLRIRPDLSSRYDRLDEPGGSYNSGSQKPISGVGMGLPCVEIKFRAPDAIDAMLSS